MNPPVITTNTSNEATIVNHLIDCDNLFTPSLSSRVDLFDYGKKLATLSDRFEAWDSGRLIGLVAAYISNSNQIDGFITSVSICRNFEGKGIASLLMKKCFTFASSNGLHTLLLEVAEQNERAFEFYRKHGFQPSGGANSDYIKMKLLIKNI